MNDLDDLLSQPLDDIPDQGFSLQVLHNMQQYRRRKAMFITAVILALLCIFIFIAPISPWLNMFSELADVAGELTGASAEFSSVTYSIIIQQILQKPMMGFTVLLIITAVFSWQEN